MANNTLKGIEYEEKKGMIVYMEKSYQNFNADIPLMKKLLEEKEKEFFHRMELVESKKSGEKEGFIIGKDEGIEEWRKSSLADLLVDRIKRKYHKDISIRLEHCQEKDLYEFNILIDDRITYDELMKRFTIY